jgi:hypothetical protein
MFSERLSFFDARLRLNKNLYIQVYTPRSSLKLASNRQNWQYTKYVMRGITMREEKLGEMPRVETTGWNRKKQRRESKKRNPIVNKKHWHNL